MHVPSSWRILAGVLVAASGAASVQAQVPALARVRGELLEVTALAVVLREPNGARTSLPAAGDLVVSEVAPLDPGALQPGVFVGTTAIPGPDGSLSAVEVHVLPEASRGRGEGHRVIDAGSGATMTNATVATVSRSNSERTIVLRYADGEKTVRVPEGVPVVTMNPGTRALLVPGAKVTVTTRLHEDRATAVRVIVGHDGYVPPF